uniref:Uncharacterized protein n=1 Tax=Magallana gigas TaxID=29159 RepID=K1Q607_MAGGI
MAVILEGNCEFEFCQRQYNISKVLCGLQKFCEITKHGMTRGNKINGVNSV